MISQKIKTNQSMARGKKGLSGARRCGHRSGQISERSYEKYKVFCYDRDQSPKKPKTKKPWHSRYIDESEVQKPKNHNYSKKNMQSNDTYLLLHCICDKLFSIQYSKRDSHMCFNCNFPICNKCRQETPGTGYEIYACEKCSKINNIIRKT